MVAQVLKTKVLRKDLHLMLLGEQHFCLFEGLRLRELLVCALGLGESVVGKAGFGALAFFPSCRSAVLLVRAIGRQ